MVPFVVPLVALATAQPPALAPCAGAGLRSGAPQRAVPWDGARAASTAPAAVFVEVRDVQGRPMPDATVALQRSWSLRPDTSARRTRTDAAGVARFDRLTPGTQLLVVQQLGFERQWHELKVLAGAADTICVRLRAWPMEIPQVVPAQSPAPLPPNEALHLSGPRGEGSAAASTVGGWGPRSLTARK